MTHSCCYEVLLLPTMEIAAQHCTLAEAAAWSYPDPIPECPKIKDLMCFFNERVAAYDMASANEAWERMAGFLERTL